jgi:tRNA A-37 threonylcarbamoyl transferase component Bud32
MGFLDRWLKKFLHANSLSDVQQQTAPMEQSNESDHKTVSEGNTEAEHVDTSKTGDEILSAIRARLTFNAAGRQFIESDEFARELTKIDSQGRSRAGDQLLADGLLISPSFELRKTLADRLLYRGERERASILLEDLLREPRYKMYALTGLGKIAESERDWAKALPFFERILADDVSHDLAKTKAHRLRALCQTQQPRENEKREELSRLLGERAAGSRYAVRKEIGRGGAAAVFQAHDRILNREVALKIYHRRGMADQRRARLVQEARVAAAFDHPHIVPIFDIEEQRDVLVMKYCAGGSFRQLLAKGRLPPRQVGEYGSILFRTLADIHDSGRLHLDMKPSNLLFDGSLLMIADFGTAGMMELGSVAGTRLYMAPEQKQEASLGPAADFFSAGLLLYEACTGRFPEGTSAGMPTAELPDLEKGPMRRGLETLFSRLFCVNPADRLQNGAEAAEQLLEAVALPGSNEQGRALRDFLEQLAESKGAKATQSLRSHWVYQTLDTHRMDDPTSSSA